MSDMADFCNEYHEESMSGFHDIDLAGESYEPERDELLTFDDAQRALSDQWLRMSTKSSGGQVRRQMSGAVNYVHAHAEKIVPEYCPSCGVKMQERTGMYGKFLFCPAQRKCKQKTVSVR